MTAERDAGDAVLKNVDVDKLPPLLMTAVCNWTI
jgi:hypothetical protein